MNSSRRPGRAIALTVLIFVLAAPEAALAEEPLPEEKASEETEEVFPVRDIPGSVVSRLDEAEQERDYFFQLPGMTGPMDSWQQWKKRLQEDHGLRFLFEWAALYQTASGTFGTEDNAFGYDLELNGTWTFAGQDTPTYSMLGFGAFQKKPMGTELTPLTLFTQYGSLYPGGTAYGDDDLVVGEFWFQQRFRNKYGIRAGYIFPLTAYDYFPFKNYRTGFVDQNNVANTVIPLPLQGLGAFAQYKPTRHLFFRLGIHDANADPFESATDTLAGEYFSIFEIGWDLNIVAREKGKPPAGHVHLSAWHQDAREDFGISSGHGFTITADQKFGRYHPFVRFGYADSDSDGPTFARQMFAVGLAFDQVFGRNQDQIGLSFSWVKPTDRSLNDQQAIDAFYRIQITPQIQFGPTLGLVIDPVNNPDEDTVIVGGLRIRVYL